LAAAPPLPAVAALSFGTSSNFTARSTTTHLSPAAGQLARPPVTQRFLARTPARIHAQAQPPPAHQSLNPPLP
jgi:hypothetical protein